MKKLYLGLIAVIAAVSCKPVCVIEGNLTGMEGDGCIYMVDAWDDSIVIDSTRYQDGVFRFEVDAAEPTMVRATWCGPCKAYMIPLAKTYELYKDKGFEVYTVSCDNNTDAWKKHVTEKNFGWIDVIGGMSMPEWKSYVISGVPTSILIDCSTGLIIGRDLHGDILDAKLEELMCGGK